MHDFTVFSTKGMEVRMPNRFISHVLTSPDWHITRLSAWEKRRNKLISKLKRNRIIRNWVIISTLRIIGLFASCVVGFLLAMGLSQLPGSGHASGRIGIVSGMAIFCGFLWSWTLIGEILPTDSDTIRVKHRNKYYA